MSKFLIIASLALSFVLVGCAYKPVGMISRVQPGEYTTTTYGENQASAMAIASEDAEGICKDKHKTEYYNIIKEEKEDLSKNVGGDGNVGAALSLAGNLFAKGPKNNYKVKLQFKCN